MAVTGSPQLSMPVTNSALCRNKKNPAKWKFLLLCTNEARNDCPCCLYKKHQPLCDASQAGYVWESLDDRE